MTEKTTDTPAPAAAVAPDELARLEGEAIANEPAPPTDPNAPPPPKEVETAEVLAMLYQPLANIVAPNWRLDATECRQLAEAHALVIDKYFPGGMNTMGPELSAVLVTLAIVGPRMMSKKPLRAPEKKPDEQAEAAA